MEREAITQEELIAIYNICKKRLTISLEDFLNNSMYENIKNNTLKRYNSLNQFISTIMNTDKFEILKENVCAVFGKDNFTDENIYAYYVDRIQEMLNMYGKVELNKLYVYCLKDKKLRSIEIKNSQLIQKDQKRIKLKGLFDYLLSDTGVNKERFLNLNDDFYEFERILLLTIDSNIDNVRECVSKLDDGIKRKFIEAIEARYHLVEVNGYYVCRYLFDNFRMIKLLQSKAGYNRLSPDNFMDIFKCSLNIGNVTLAYKYIKKDNTNAIRNAYLELKDNERFKELVRFPKDDLGITFTAIRLLGENLEEVNQLNKYLGFMNKINLTKYVLMSDEEKKDCLREAVLYYKKKLLKGTKDSCIDFIKNIYLFEDLRKEEKDLIINNYRNFLEEVFNLAYEVCYYLDFKLISDLIYYVSNKVIQIIMIEAQDETLEVDKIEFLKSEYEDAMFYVNNYYNFRENVESNFFVNDLKESFHVNLDDIFTKCNELDRQKYVNDILNLDDNGREERIKEWKEQLLRQYKDKHSDNSYEFFGALYDLLGLYERKTGKQYDPAHCLFSFEDVYNYYYLSDEEKKTFEDELIIEEDF